MYLVWSRPTIIYFALMLILLVIHAFFLLNLQNTIKSCSRHNRLVAPWTVWLNMIPVVNYIWPFILNPKISGSIKKEMEEKTGPSDYDDYGKTAGLVYPSIGVVYILLMVYSYLNYEPINGFIPKLITIIQMIAMVVFWVKTASYKNQLGIKNESDDLLDIEF